MTNNDTPRLVDPFGRVIDYVRVSLTDKCNFRCFYCLPKGARDFELPENYLSSDELVRVIKAFSELGVRRIRLTGGEPLVRRDLPEIAHQIGHMENIDDLSLSTNASLLAPHAKSLKSAGISRVNVSLDTLDPDRFREITNAELQPVLDGLKATRSAGLEPVKINMVVMKGVNDDEVVDMADFCIEHGFTLRYIETMPVGDAGRDASDQYLSLDVVKKRLENKFRLIPSVMSGGGPARYFKIENTHINIGFITPISQHFCETCNRIRLAVDGTLYLCLGQENSYPLKPLLRDGVDDDALKQAIIEALALKPEKHEFKDKPGTVVRFMSSTGG